MERSLVASQIKTHRVQKVKGWLSQPLKNVVKDQI